MLYRYYIGSREAVRDYFASYLYTRTGISAAEIILRYEESCLSNYRATGNRNYYDPSIGVTVFYGGR